jgi:hypothetical protein
MKGNLLQNTGFLSLCLGIAGLTVDAHAGLPSIEGSLSFVGVPVLNGPAGSATAITNFSSDTVTSSAPGNYAGLGGLVAGWSPFAFAPAVVPVVPLWTFSTNGLTYSFDATSVQLDFQNTNFINIYGSGIAHLTGYADTPGTWSIGISQIRSSYTFVASTSVSATNLPLLHYVANTGTVDFTWNAMWGQPYRVQTSTNLSQTNWINLGGVITTTNPVATLSDVIGPDPNRFYRVILLP